MQNPKHVGDYLVFLEHKTQREKSTNFEPNFWMTNEYLHRCGAKLCIEDGVWGVKRNDSNVWLFPPIKDDRIIYDGTYPYEYGFMYHNKSKIYQTLTQSKNTQEVDRQYIYNPRQFRPDRMTGKKWLSFRRNVRKWPKRNSTSALRYIELFDDVDSDLVEDLLLKWAKGKTLYDVEVFSDFVLNGRYRWGLYRDGELVGINVADYNWSFVVYRCCIDNGEPFLQEYLRWLFYTSEFVLEQQRDKFVNDGGDLDNEGLRNFKTKLNPIAVLSVLSIY